MKGYSQANTALRKAVNRLEIGSKEFELVKEAMKSIVTQMHTDRLFLEEVFKRMPQVEYEQMSEYPRVLLTDWMREMIDICPMSGKNEKSIKETAQGEDWKDYYFENQSQLKEFLGIGEGVVKFEIGDHVTYQTEHDKEKGIVKSYNERMDDHIFVVFNCGGEWANYQNYTAVNTPLKNLRLGW